MHISRPVLKSSEDLGTRRKLSFDLSLAFVGVGVPSRLAPLLASLGPSGSFQ